MERRTYRWLAGGNTAPGHNFRSEDVFKTHLPAGRCVQDTTSGRKMCSRHIFRPEDVSKTKFLEDVSKGHFFVLEDVSNTALNPSGVRICTRVRTKAFSLEVGIGRIGRPHKPPCPLQYMKTRTASKRKSE